MVSNKGMIKKTIYIYLGLCIITLIGIGICFILGMTEKKEDSGISIVISGLISEIQRAIEEVGLSMHTVHFSLGTFGKKELLPTEKVLEITTSCGHHCISAQSVEHYVDLIKKGKISIERAAEKLAKPCVCGISNTKRYVEILKELSQG